MGAVERFTEWEYPIALGPKGWMLLLSTGDPAEKRINQSYKRLAGIHQRWRS